MRYLFIVLLYCYLPSKAVGATIQLQDFQHISSKVNSITLNVDCGKLASINLSGEKLENVDIQVTDGTLFIDYDDPNNTKTNIMANIIVPAPIMRLDVINQGKVKVDKCAIDKKAFHLQLEEMSVADIEGVTTQLDATLTDQAIAVLNLVAENANIHLFETSILNAKKAFGKLKLSLLTDSSFNLTASVNLVELNIKEGSKAKMCNTANSTISGIITDASSLSVHQSAEIEIANNNNSHIVYCGKE